MHLYSRRRWSHVYLVLYISVAPSVVCLLVSPRIGPSRRLWTADEMRDAAGGGGKWVHDRFESLLEEEASQRHPRSRGLFQKSHRGAKGAAAAGQRPSVRGGLRGPHRERARGRRSRGKKREEEEWFAVAGNHEQGNAGTAGRTTWATTGGESRSETHSGTPPSQRGQGGRDPEEVIVAEAGGSPNEGRWVADSC